MDVPRTTITAIELLTTGCYGTCPAFDVRFTADGRATYAGSGYAPRLGRFIGRVDFVRLAAWIDSQQPETLANSYAMGWIDTPHVTLVVERGAYRKIVTTANETQTPVRLQGMVLALEGLTDRLRWTPVDDLTPYAGTFARGRTVIVVSAISEKTLGVSGRAEAFRCGGDIPGTARLRDALRLTCAGRASILRPVSRGVVATGDALAPGLYERITQREAARRFGLMP